MLTNLPVGDADGTRQSYLAARRLFAGGRLKPAEAALTRILVNHPRYFDALLLLAKIRSQRDQPKRAEALLRRALAAKPWSAAAQHSLGIALKMQRRYQEAERRFRRALVLDPGFAEAEIDLGNTLLPQGYLNDAVKSLRHAIVLKPALAQAHHYLGNALLTQGQVAAAKECYCRAIALKPDYAAAHCNLAFTMNYDDHASPAETYAAHRAWAALFPSMEKLNRTCANDRRPDRRLRIGYVSADFCCHSVSYFFESLLASHNRSEVEVFCYSSLHEADEDATTKRLRSQADHWISIFRRNDQDVAARIRADCIDILVDLGGFTSGSRIAVFALKPAPVQATWMGYPNTTGLAAMDYRLTDAIADPEGETDRFNSETLFRLRPPFLCYRPPDDAPPVSAPPVLEAGHLTFGSFNNLPKLTPGVIKLWSRLLHAVPGSRLAIKSEQIRDPSTADQLRDHFANQGVTPDRLDFFKWRVTTAGHLTRYALVDIALDPFPYNGTTTTCEALWMGVPIVTLRGDRHCGRVGASLLSSVGLQELVTEDPESYMETAARLGRDASRLMELRFGLRDRMRASRLCDAPGFARALEQAYRRMWQSWCAHPAPAGNRHRDDCQPAVCLNV